MVDEQEIIQMAKDGIPRNTICLRTKIPRKEIERILKGTTQPNNLRVPDPTPEEILERRREITPWMDK